MKKRTPKNSEQGVALVTTVIVVAVLAVVAVAMMQSTTVDRLSSRSVANYYRARLAADAGLAAAQAAIARNSTNDTFIVVANTNRQLFVGNGVGTGTDFSYVPLLSTVSSVTSAVAPIVSATVPAANVAAGVYFTNNLAGGLSVTSPAVSWVYLTDAAGRTNGRFAYWVEDLGGRVDLSVAGSSDSAVSRRPTGTNPAELALWSYFNPSSANDTGNATVSEIAAARSNIVTTATARLVTAAVTTNMLSELASNLRHDTNEPEVIPFGFGYPDAGKAKYNLNSYISQAGVSSIADAINRNLPKFGTRGGAMNAEAYVKGIAASIVDYADADADPSVDNGTDPTYLGIENIPWPNELFDRITAGWGSGSPMVTTSGKIRVMLKDWAEFWNMGDTATEETTISIQNNYDLVLTFTNTLLGYGFRGNLKDASVANGTIGDKRNFDVPALEPNEYVVLECSDPEPTLRLEWQIPNASSYSTAPFRSAWQIAVSSNTETTNMVFKAFVGSTMIQQSKGGRWPRYLSAMNNLQSPSPLHFIFANPIGFSSQDKPSSQGGVPAHSGGDPRAQLFLSGSLRSHNYTNKYSSPGGRNWENYNMANYAESEVHPGKFWPDNGHAADGDRGDNPTSYSQNPTGFAKDPLPDNYVMVRNDTGSFDDIFELGFIYDPLQWADSYGTTVTNQPGLWANLTMNATPDARFGGRNTLRVGRWEFSKFTNSGTRASQLLDIFAVGTNTSGPVTNRVAGRININTAGTNALRALGAGVYLESDPMAMSDTGAAGTGTNMYVPKGAVDDFVSAVSSTRSRKPFSSTSELNMIGTETVVANWPTNAVFGNRTRQFISAGNDAMREEWFAKVCPLATVRSRNFLVHVVGQAVLTNNPTMPVSTARRMYQVYIQPVRATTGASAGLTTNCIPRVLGTWDL